MPDTDREASATPSSEVWATVARLMAVCVWALVAYVQVTLVITRILPSDHAPWPLGNIIGGLILIYLPVGLAGTSFWLTRRRSFALGAVAHLAGMALTLTFWLA